MESGNSWFSWGIDKKKIIIIAGVALIGTGIYFLSTKKVVKRPISSPSNNSNLNKAQTIPTLQQPSAEDLKNAMELAGFTEEEENSLKSALEHLLKVSDHNYEEDQILKAVKTIQKLTNHKKTLDVIRVSGALDSLLILLAQRSSNKKLNRHLLLALSNLVTSKSNRRMFDSNSLKDLIAILSATDEDEIKEATLRTLMNITVEREYEDKVREVGGLPPIIDIVVSESTSEGVRLQAVRLLVNLIWNTKNKNVMLEYGLLDVTIKYLLGDPSEQLAIRFIRLLGYFSVNTEATTYKKAAAPDCAKSLVRLMKKYNSAPLAEAVAITVSKITVPRELSLQKPLEGFKKAFLEVEDGAAVAILIGLLNSEKSAFRYNSLCALTNLARDSDLAVQKIKEVDGGLDTIKKLCVSDDPKTKERATELLRFLSFNVESVD